MKESRAENAPLTEARRNSGMALNANGVRVHTYSSGISGKKKHMLSSMTFWVAPLMVVATIVEERSG